MNEDRELVAAMQLQPGSDLQTVLAAWHAATVRLERTHEALCAEVQRLTRELEAKNRELARKNRLADLGQMAAHVAHEVRNTLMPVTLYLGLLRRRIAHDPASLEVLEKVATGFAALEATVSDLLQFSADRDPQWQTFPLAPLVEELLISLAPQMEAQTIQSEVDIPPSMEVVADRELIRRALRNLMVNALDAMPQGGTLSVRAQTTSEGVTLEVADTGPGLSEETLGRAFEPFYTTKPGGTGLGLAIVYRIAEAHGATVAAANRPEGGARFTFSLPLVSQEAAA